MFQFKKMKIYVYFRKYLKPFLQEMKKYFEIIAWTSSQKEYSDQVIETIEKNLDFKFDHCLSIDEQIQAEDNTFYVKNIDILCGKNSGRDASNIIVIDSQMTNFSNKLTNGIYLPPFRLNSVNDDICFNSLGNYLKTFIMDDNKELIDVRLKIKTDFDLLTIFNNNKQSQSFNKILKRTVEKSGHGALKHIGVSAQKETVRKIS